MHDWLGIGLIALGLGLAFVGLAKRRSRTRTPLPTAAIRPEFAAVGAMVRPLILFAVGIFALKISLFYFVFAGKRFLTPLDFGGIMFVLAAYSGYLVAATTQRPTQAVEQPSETEMRSAA